MTGLEISARRDGSLCILELRGEARLETVNRLDQEAADAIEGGAQDLILDMTHLQFMDSASTGSLLRLDTEVGNGGGSLVLCGMRRVIQRLLERAGLQERFRTAADEAGARELLA